MEIRESIPEGEVWQSEGTCIYMYVVKLVVRKLYASNNPMHTHYTVYMCMQTRALFMLLRVNVFEGTIRCHRLINCMNHLL